MKTINSFKTVSVILFIACATAFVSCKKEETAPAITNTTTSDPASIAVGNFIGSGEDASGNTFVNKVVKVTKLSNTRIKVEPVGHSYITSFEINVMGVPTGTVNDQNENTDFAVRNDTNPFTIGFDCPSGQNFGGQKQ